MPTEEEIQLYTVLYTALEKLTRGKSIPQVTPGIVYPLSAPWSFVRVDDDSQSVNQLLLLPSTNAVRRYSYLTSILEGAPHQASRYQEGLLLSFGSRKEIKGEDYERIRFTEVKFRGSKAWPILRLLAPPAWPLRPSAGLLQAFVPVIEELSTLVCESALSEAWPEPVKIEAQAPEHSLPQTYLQRLLALPQHDENWLLDAAILPGTQVRPTPDGPPVMQQVILLANFQAPAPQPPELISRTALVQDELVEALTRQIEQDARPLSITVRDPDIEALLTPLCDALKIRLIVRPQLPIIDRYLPELQRALQDPPQP